MKRPDPEVVRALASTVRQYPAILEWISDWKKLEMEALPYNGANVAVAQGRCQVLSELLKLAKEAPELAAQSR